VDQSLLGDRPMLTDPFGTSKITYAIGGCAIKVHDIMGPGLFENIYSECLQYELKEAGLSFELNRAAPVVYKGVRLKSKYFLDLLVEGIIPVELKCIAAILQVHKKQLLSQVRLLNMPVGLLINFNVDCLSDGGIKRVVNAKYKSSPAPQVEPGGNEKNE
jgi:GxxExxY protein